MTKRLVYQFFVSFMCVIAVAAVGAHGVSAHAGGPPYVLINGTYAQTNPILNTLTPVSIPMGADVATTSGYPVNEPVVFEVDMKVFPNPYAQAQNPFGIPVTHQNTAPDPVFQWDFKDSTSRTEGSRIPHTFTKPGTYIVVLSAKYPGNTTEFSQVNTIQITVLPDMDYQMPQARILVNSVQISDPLRDTVTVKPMTPVVFDASRSSGNVVKYEWDFGDEKGAAKKTVTHRYGRDVYFPTVMLRVTDDKGIVSDTYALLDLPFQKNNPVMSVYFAVADFIAGIFRRE